MKTNKGSGLVFAVVLLFVILVMVVTLSGLTVLETKMSQKTKSSVGAFYNSESGVEWALNKIANTSGDSISDAFPGFAGNRYPCPAGFNCNVYFLDGQGQVIAADGALDTVKAVRSVGTQAAGEQTQRAIEAAVAASRNDKYRVSCTSPGQSNFFICVRIDTEDGSTECKSSGGAPWINCPQGFPFAASTAGDVGKYNISCTHAGASSNIYMCVRINTENGDTECRSSQDASGWFNCGQGAPF